MLGVSERSQKPCSAGYVHAYVHTGNQVGVLLELNCETDFVARTAEIKNLAQELALQIASMKPAYIAEEDVPHDVFWQEYDICREAASQQSSIKAKPPEIQEKIIQGKFDKVLDQLCLLRQTTIRDPGMIVREQIQEVSAKVGENILIKRFVRSTLVNKTKSSLYIHPPREIFL
ncbi:MAG: hypothetical protein H7831_11660 [Magnetococcus sp. WYHC-3]